MCVFSILDRHNTDPKMQCSLAMTAHASKYIIEPADRAAQPPYNKNHDACDMMV